MWTTGASVRRYSWLDDAEYEEVLSLEPGAVRLDRLNAGAPFVDTHSTYCLDNVIGSVVPGSAKIEGGRGVATILLSRAPGVADTVQKIREGVIRNVSVGYWQHKIVRTEGSDGQVAQHVVEDWEPLEISAVPVPADPGSQIRSEQAGESEAQTRSCLVVTRNPARGPNSPATQETPMATRTKKPSAPKPGKGAAKTPAEIRAAKAAAAEERRLAAREADEEGGDDEDEEERADEADEGREADDEEERDGDEADDERDGDDEDESNADDERGGDDEDEKRGAAAAIRRAADLAVKRERDRTSKITELARQAGLTKLGERHVGRGTSVNEFRNVLLGRMLENQKKRGAGTFPANGEGSLGDAPAAAPARSRDFEKGAAEARALLGKSADK